MGCTNYMYGGAKKYEIHPLLALLIAIIGMVILLHIGFYMWNNVLVKVCTIVKPVTSVFEILGLTILINILFNF